ncbi:MAG: carboxynorspermidine decarboxylase [Deltaproteobacteria bacterium]
MLETPYYLIDEQRLLKNLKIIERIRRVSGARFVLALKCFSAWSAFGLMRPYLDGTTSSSPFEARLGREKFGKEVHAYCVGYGARDVAAVRPIADKIIFNSLSQLKRFAPALRGRDVGVRVNPGVSYSRFDLADPGRRCSRLGVTDTDALVKALALVNGVMFHFNCENDDVRAFCRQLDFIAATYGAVLSRVMWVSLGGGLYFTKEGYPVDAFAAKLREFGERFRVQVYCEPGESVITQAGELVTTVVDVVKNGMDIAIVDASTEAHMLDLLVYRQAAKIKGAGRGRYRCMVAGRSCLAGDVFGTYRFARRPKVGDTIRFADAAGYTMVKKNWFNGLAMPAIVVRGRDGRMRVVRRFSYKDFAASQS